MVKRGSGAMRTPTAGFGFVPVGVRLVPSIRRRDLVLYTTTTQICSKCVRIESVVSR